MKFLQSFFSVIVIMGAIVPVVLFAQPTTPRRDEITPPTIPGGETVTSPTTPRGVEGGGSSALQNPLKVDSLEDLLLAILQIVIVLATPIVVLFIILAGFKYVTARGDATKTKEATLALTYAVIGGILIIGAVAIAEIIGNLVGAFSE